MATTMKASPCGWQKSYPAIPRDDAEVAAVETENTALVALRAGDHARVRKAERQIRVAIYQRTDERYVIQAAVEAVRTVSEIAEKIVHDPLSQTLLDHVRDLSKDRYRHNERTGVGFEYLADGVVFWTASVEELEQAGGVDGDQTGRQLALSQSLTSLPEISESSPAPIDLGQGRDLAARYSVSASRMSCA